jgi:RHS repeat-associated protein
VTFQDLRVMTARQSWGAGYAPTDINATYTWDNMGRMTAMNYPVSGPQVAMSYDAMSRLAGETQTCVGTNCQNPGTAFPLAGAVYNFAGQLTTLNYNDLSITGTVYLPGWLQTETRTYNNMLQLTRIVNSPNSAYGADGVALNMTYNFSAAQNNGRILSSVDGVTGENVSYTYDSLNRLIAASTSGTAGVQWGNSYSYDGFGNLTGKTVTKGTAPTLSPLVDPNTNRVRMSGDYGYDANGNWMGVPSAPNTWNVENQLLSTGMVDGDGNLVTYTYDPWGRRVMQYGFGAPNTTGTATLYFYSITGKRLGTYTVSYEAVTGASGITMYFGARPLKAVDRLGSVRAKFGSNGMAQMAYYPWGEERTSTADGTDKFATYFRDTFGQDYAKARYFNSNLGRFWSPDPLGVKAVDPKNPTSWNLYAYVNGDPVNFKDPGGLFLPADPPSDGGGDDPDPDPVAPPARPTAPAFTSKWTKALEKLVNAEVLLQDLSPSANCQKDLDKLANGPAGRTLDEIQAQANATKLNDATTSTTLERDLFTAGTDEYSPWANSSMTVAQFFKNDPSVKAEAASTISAAHDNIYFDPSYVNTNSVQFDAALMMHELLHNLGRDDAQLQSALGIPASSASGAITQMLFSDCFKK